MKYEYQQQDCIAKSVLHKIHTGFASDLHQSGNRLTHKPNYHQTVDFIEKE